MKLALVATALGTHGGTERVLFGFSQWLARGHDVTVFVERVDEAPPGVKVEILPVHGPGRLVRSVSRFRASRKVADRTFDCVVGFGRGSGHQVYRAGGGCHRAWLEARGGFRPSDPVDLWLDRRAVASARIVVVNSRMAMEDLRRHYGVSDEKMRLVYNGVDLDRFRPRERQGTFPGPVVGFVGTGFHRKGLSTAIAAVARLEGVHLVVVGRDAHQGRYEALAARARLQSRVHFLGARSDPEVILPEMDVLCLPTLYDPFANVTLEALAAGVPVVTSRKNGGAEIVPEPWMVVADPHDHEAVGAALERALQSSRGTLVAACRRRAEEFPADRTFAGLWSVIEEVTA